MTVTSILLFAIHILVVNAIRCECMYEWMSPHCHNKIQYGCSENCNSCIVTNPNCKDSLTMSGEQVNYAVTNCNTNTPVIKTPLSLIEDRWRYQITFTENSFRKFKRYNNKLLYFSHNKINPFLTILNADLFPEKFVSFNLEVNDIAFIKDTLFIASQNSLIKKNINTDLETTLNLQSNFIEHHLSYSTSGIIWTGMEGLKLINGTSMQVIKETNIRNSIHSAFSSNDKNIAVLLAFSLILLDYNLKTLDFINVQNVWKHSKVIFLSESIFAINTKCCVEIFSITNNKINKVTTRFITLPSNFEDGTFDIKFENNKLITTYGYSVQSSVYGGVVVLDEKYEYEAKYHYTDWMTNIEVLENKIYIATFDDAIGIFQIPVNTILKTTSGTVESVKDPHLSFAHGGKADFRGENNSIYNILSAKDVNVNIYIEYAKFKLHEATIDGSFMTQLHFVGKTNKINEMKVSMWASKIKYKNAGWANGTCINDVFSIGPHGEKKCDDIIARMDYSSLNIYTKEWYIRATPMPVYNKLSGPSNRIDIRIVPRIPEKEINVSPHGLIGQSFDGDNIAVFGKQDNYPKNGYFKTSAMAEGAIEGVPNDYKMSNIYSITFKFSRFNAVNSSPRNVSQLSGMKKIRSQNTASITHD